MTFLSPQFHRSKLLKRDLFGQVEKGTLLGVDGSVVVRDLGVASVWTRPVAMWLARNEARALAALHPNCQPNVELAHHVPRLLSHKRTRLYRTWVEGTPMHLAPPTDAAYFEKAQKLLDVMHGLGVYHNDLAKEPNWLVTPDGNPAVLDFQVAMVRPPTGALRRVLAYDDRRHLLKHKRTYFPEALSAEERTILDNPSRYSTMWKNTGKRLYMFVTRGLLGWADVEGAEERIVLEEFSCPRDR